MLSSRPMGMETSYFLFVLYLVSSIVDSESNTLRVLELIIAVA